MIRPLVWSLLAVEAAAATLVAAWPWLGAYAMPATPGLLTVAAVASVAVPLAVGLVWRRSALVSYGVSLVALAALLLIGVSGHPTAVASGLASGASHLVTDTLPLSSPRSFLGPPVVLTWLTGAAVSELLTRTRRVAPATGVVVLSFLAAYAAGSGAPRPPVATGAIVLCLVGALAITGRVIADADRPIAATADAPAGRRWRPAAGGGTLVAAVAMLALIAVPALPGVGGRPATVARGTPTTSAVSISPLDAISSLRDDRPEAPPVTVLKVTTGQPSSGYLALALLDGYDGDTWSFDRTFAPTGGRVPLPPAGVTVTVGPPVVQRYTLAGPLGPELPFVAFMDRPAQVSGLSVDMDPVSGMVVPARRMGPATSYTVVSHSPARTLSLVPATAAFEPEGAGTGNRLPADASGKMTPVLQYLAAATGGQPPAPTVHFLQAVLGLMHDRDRRVGPPTGAVGANTGRPPTKGGTSLAEVVDAITVRGAGTPEQFATLFAVVARDLGVPARVVTGFRIAGPARPSLGAGSYQVTNRDAWTWVEVPVAGEGWVVADPTPGVLAAATDVPASGVQTPSTTIAPPRADAVPGNAPGGRAVAPPARVTIPRHHHWSATTWALAGLAALAGTVVVTLGAALTQAAVRRWWRRRLRRASDPAAVTVGGWLEMLDVLWRGGVSPPMSATNREVAELAGRRFGVDVGAPVGQVGELCDVALCSARPRVDAAAAGAAWDAQRQAARLVRRQLGPRQRVRSALAVGRAPRRPVGHERRGERR